MAEKTQRINDYKKNAVTALKDIIENARDFIFTDYRGMTVGQITDLRKKLGEEQAKYKVVKNNYMNLALRETGKPEAGEYLIGPTGITFIVKDVGPVAKILVNTAKEAPLVIKGGIIEGKIYGKDDILAFSRLPSRDELIASFMGSLKAPVQNTAYVLSGVMSKLVRTVKAIADAKSQ